MSSGKDIHKSSTSQILFASAAYVRLEPKETLPAKFGRLLKILRLEERVNKKRVGVKMHFGGNICYSTRSNAGC